MLTCPDLPIYTNSTLRFSGERDASSIQLSFAGEIPLSTFPKVTTFYYAGISLGTWSPGSGTYNNQSGSVTTEITYNIGIQKQDRAELVSKGYELFTVWELEVRDLVLNLVDKGCLLYTSDAADE